MRVELIADSTFSLHDIQQSLGNDLVAWTRVLKFDDRNRIIIAMCTVECDLADTLRKDAIAE